MQNQNEDRLADARAAARIMRESRKAQEATPAASTAAPGPVVKPPVVRPPLRRIFKSRGIATAAPPAPKKTKFTSYTLPVGTSRPRGG